MSLDEARAMEDLREQATQCDACHEEYRDDSWMRACELARKLVIG